MRNETSYKELFFAMAGLFLCLVVLLFLVGPAFAEDDDIPITCYKGGSRIGTAIVFDWRAAAATCNTLYYDCRGICYGCFRDNDYIEDVCVDSRGNEFLR